MKRRRGPLVPVDLGHGRAVKMHREDAERLGYVQPKRRQPSENKLRVPDADKAAEPEADFTTIPGIGAATAAQIRATGIRTLAQLRAADLSFLSSRAAAAVEAWRG